MLRGVELSQLSPLVVGGSLGRRMLKGAGMVKPRKVVLYARVSSNAQGII